MSYSCLTYAQTLEPNLRKTRHNQFFKKHKLSQWRPAWHPGFVTSFCEASGKLLTLSEP